jgi:hypothetical protein
MAETTTQATQPAASVAKFSRKTIRAKARNKRKLKLKTDKEFAKTYFAAKSKRSTDRKSAFRKKKKGKAA